MGPSGSGKSTLLHLLGGVDTPTSGHVLLEGVDLGTLRDDDRSRLRRRRIGFVFQKINLLPTLSALENVALPLLLDGLARREAIRRASAALADVGMTPRLKHVPHEMSGGEQQRVAVARALVIRPAVILADEPTGSLDSANSVRVVELLRELAVRGQAVVTATHNRDVAGLADRCLLFRDGQIAETTNTMPPVCQEAP
jgi:putative ABC transport system ATP-binding protein